MTIVFDLDNTLIDRNNAYWLWLEDSVLPRDIAIDKMTILYYDNWGYTSRYHFYNWLISTYALTNTPKALMEQCAEELHQYLTINDEVLGVLQHLKQSHTLVVGTNGSVKNQMNKLKTSGIIEYIQHIYVSEAISYKKPNSNFYMHIQKCLNCNAEDMLMIGDHFKQDYQAPKQVGWQSIWLSYNRPVQGISQSINDLTQLELLVNSN